METKIKIISFEEAQPMIKHPPNITYCRQFFDFTSGRYGLKGGFLAISGADCKIFCLIPINYSDKEIYATYKEDTEPYFLANEERVNAPIDWLEVAKAAKKQLGISTVEFNFSFISGGRSIKGLKQTPFPSFVLKLGESENRETILGKLKKETRTSLKKAEKSGFTTKIIGAEKLDEIYNLYIENMKRHGTPARPFDYFNDLFRYFGDKCFCVSVYDEDILAGLNLVIAINGYMKLHFNLSKTEYWPRQINNLLYYKMIEIGNEMGMKIIDFGGNSNKDIGLSKFKLGFGASQFPCFKLTSAPFNYKIMKWIERKKRHLAIRVNKLLKKYD